MADDAGQPIDPDTFARRLSDLTKKPAETGPSSEGAPTPAEAAPKEKPKTPDKDTFAVRLGDLVKKPEEPATEEEAAEAEAGPAPPSAEPVGTGEHVVRPGECISSIARDTGHFWDTLWKEPGNTELRTARGEPNVLMPGDRVFVPPIRPKQEPGQSEMRHRFIRRGEPSKIRMTVKRGGEPRRNEPYTLEVDGQVFTGILDPEGKFEQAIPGNARKGKLIVGEGEDAKEYPLKLGGLDPVDSLAGVQARLTNLGFGAGEATGGMNEKTEAAVRKFQAKHGLPETGVADQATRAKLKEIHGF
jgi:N-acetylmuramoyl-L-alanine amidase